MWKWVSIAHSKGGDISGSDSNGVDVFFTVCIGLNTIVALFSWVFIPPRGDRNYNKFFNVKK